MRIHSILMLTVGLAFIPVRASAQCPTNVAGGSVMSFEHRIESSSPTWSSSVVCGNFALDLIAGTIRLTSGGGGGEYSCGGYLTASDLYQIVGPASADPIPLEVRVHLTGDITAQLHSYPFIGLICDGAEVQFRLSSGTVSTEFTESNGYQPCQGTTFLDDLVLQLSKFPGDSFPVRYDLGVNARGGEGTIRGEVFFDLPAGYTIVSCQGYVGQPVASLPTSWGRLKQVYR